MLKVNEYFAGKVKSIGFDSSSIGLTSVGVMEEGEYTFSTAQPEEMTVITGALKVLLPGRRTGRCLRRVRSSSCRGTASSTCRWPTRPPICAAT